MLLRMGDRCSNEAPKILAYKLEALMQQQNVHDLDHRRIPSKFSVASLISRGAETQEPRCRCFVLAGNVQARAQDRVMDGPGAPDRQAVAPEHHMVVSGRARDNL